jgi:hypothetical protein
MSRNSKWVLGLGLALALTAATRAQEAGPDAAAQAGAPGPGRGHGPGFGGPFGERMELLGFGGMHGGKTVTGAPFSATAVGESRQTLSDGTVISHKFQSNLYRDAQGRFRREVTLPAVGPLAANGGPKSFVMIHDPVAQTGYVLEPDQKVARKLPPHGKRGADAADGGKKHPDDANVKKESLGTQTINGVNAEGTRYTRTIPAGQVGNDKPLTIVREEWYSPDLQMVVQSKHTDPFMGEMTYAVTNIQRAAPNASLFTVPADYTVKEGPPAGMAGRGHGMHHAAPGDGPPPPGDF